MAPTVNVTRKVYCTAVVSVSVACAASVEVSANMPRIAFAAKLPGTIGMQPTTSSAFCEMSVFARSTSTKKLTTSAAANDDASRFQPQPRHCVRTASAMPPVSAHHGSERKLMLNSTPKPAAASAPQTVWCKR